MEVVDNKQLKSEIKYRKVSLRVAFVSFIIAYAMFVHLFIKDIYYNEYVNWNAPPQLLLALIWSAASFTTFYQRIRIVICMKKLSKEKNVSNDNHV